MMPLEPARSPYDLRFQLGRFPVRVHPAFWIISVLFAIGGPSTPTTIAIWVGAVFVSILIHELGHAALMRRYGLAPHIVLHGMGGLAVADHGFRSQSRRERIFISAAGPGAGFLFGLAIAGLIFALSYQVHVFGLPIGIGTPPPSPAVHLALSDLLYINFGWGLVNLVPVQPLDGSHIAEELLGARDPDRAHRRALWLSVVSGLAMSVIGFIFLGSAFTGLFFGYLAYASYETIRRHRGIPPASPRELWARFVARWRRTRRRIEHQVVETLAKESVKNQAQVEERALSRPEIKEEAEKALESFREEAKRARKKPSRVGGEDEPP